IDGTGTVSGTIKLVGTAPVPTVIVAKGAAKRDATVCGADAAIIDQSLQVGPGNGIANVFVYIDKAPPGATIPAAPAEDVVFDQKGCVFIPHALVVRTGQTIRIKSQDAAGHNTKTNPVRSQRFDQTIPALERTGVPLFYDKHEKRPFLVACTMHTWMRAYHLALEHPWGTITKPDGTFELKGLPATTVTLRVWHEKAGGKGGFLQRSLKVNIPKDGTISQDLEFQLTDFGL
ncbi:MAG: hypothetical protein VX311_00990, partial [Planctomycetota bacterium]|nr:hypothetical protein [Planctomycetota bacterium]